LRERRCRGKNAQRKRNKPSQLPELLQEADANSPAFLSEHQRLFQQALGDRFAPLASALQAFDLAQRLRILEAQAQAQAQGRGVSAIVLEQEVTIRALRHAVHLADDCKAQLLIEVGRLKGQGVDLGGQAAAPPSLGFGQGYQPARQA